ncbi:MAG TPA: hypothetical protein VNP72_11515 [Longimicrobium sp.]|nr:hypothetical protein [Longimicrobium sp.]
MPKLTVYVQGVETPLTVEMEETALRDAMKQADGVVQLGEWTVRTSAIIGFHPRRSSTPAGAPKRVITPTP